jgi:hypothetical protein
MFHQLGPLLTFAVVATVQSSLVQRAAIHGLYLCLES